MEIKAINGHNMGECTVVNNIAFVSIPKNASTSLRSMGEQDNFLRNQHKQYVIILRDPFSRWISGLREYCKRNTGVDGSVVVEQLAQGQIVFDEHTVPQIQFIRLLLDEAHVDYYLLERKSLKKLNKKYKLWNETPVLNVKDPKQADDFQKVLDYIEGNQQLINNVKEYYKEDYELINAKVINKPK